MELTYTKKLNTMGFIVYFTEIFSIYGGGGLDALLDIGRVNKQVFNHMVVVGSWGECLLGP